MSGGARLEEAKTRALEYLARRDRSLRETQAYLEKKSFSPAVVRQTLDYLVERHYLDEERFVRSWGQSRIRTAKIGRLRLQQELVHKGLETDVVRAAVEDLYAGLDELKLARDCARKNPAKWRGLEPGKKRRRMAQFLERKGFSSETIRRVLEQLAPLDAGGETPQEP
ncbi:MAG: regulatory protein RecX [Nitrospinae bacterium]|nr:regulatory protein RecX [Nitrospinota bacterium]